MGEESRTELHSVMSHEPPSQPIAHRAVKLRWKVKFGRTNVRL